MLQREGRRSETGRTRGGLLAVLVAVVAAVSACSSSATDAATGAPTGASTGAVAGSSAGAANAAPAVATSATGTAGATAGTRVVVVEPWQGSAPAPGVTVTGTVSGHCFAPSIATTRTDAYRCLSGNDIYDPCFAPLTTPPGTQVLCVDGPSANRFLRVKLTQPLPAAGTGKPEVAPFALLLGDSQFCLRNSGAEKASSSLPLTYTCPKGVLFGFPDTAEATWTIGFQPTGGSSLASTPISVAYR